MTDMQTYRAHAEAEVGEFMEEKLIASGKGWFSGTQVYEAYEKWWRERKGADNLSLPPLSAQMFCRILGERIMRTRTANGRRYIGYRIT